MSWHRWRQIRSISWDSQQICLSNISMLHCRLEMWCTHIRGERFFQWKVNWRYNLTYLNDVDHMYNICNPHRFCTRASMGHAISWMQQLRGKFLVQNYLGQMTMIRGSLSSLSSKLCITFKTDQENPTRDQCIVSQNIAFFWLVTYWLRLIGLIGHFARKMWPNQKFWWEKCQPFRA